ncbi:unnamed protein product [Cuscuta campestris]|uniref:Uncharacterized protein n=1 Tax=Cuscuta campestris TaxID=132261 RepID=A0A484KVY2_9ASTE|nr:unnamed protein product [Cuscuta campestris]
MEEWRLVHKFLNTDLNSTRGFILHDGDAFCGGENSSRVLLFNLQSGVVDEDHEYELVARGHEFSFCDVDVHQIAEIIAGPVPSLLLPSRKKLEARRF